jgi:hypothetical protein
MVLVTFLLVARQVFTLLENQHLSINQKSNKSLEESKKELESRTSS